MAGVPIYRMPIPAEWIDYNGHLRDAYYGLILSYATDALMDRLGLDAAYRQRTGYSLYTGEMHIHYLHEVHKTDIAIVTVRIIAADHKRIHAAFDLLREGQAGAAATAEVMLLSVHQGPAVTTQPFTAQVRAGIDELQRASAAMPASGPGSRRMELRGR